MLLLVAFTFSTATAAEPNYLVTRSVYYGDPSRPDRELQSLDIYWQDSLGKRPVIIYVHGGGWAFGDKSDVHHKPGFFALHDISFVSMNYRLRWDYELYDQLEDIVSVVDWVKRHHENYGLDPGRIVLMGNGAGGHLVSLIGTNEDYLQMAELGLKDIKAVVAIDTPSYDIDSLMTHTGTFLERRRHRVVFGEDPKVWQAASPISHVASAEHIPPFALLYDPENQSTSIQAKEFSRGLRNAGADVIMIPGNQKTAQTIDERLGTPKDAPSLALIAFLRAAL